MLFIFYILHCVYPPSQANLAKAWNALEVEVFVINGIVQRLLLPRLLLVCESSMMRIMRETSRCGAANAAKHQQRQISRARRIILVGFTPVGGPAAPYSLIPCHSEGTAWLCLDLSLKPKRSLVGNEKGSSKWMAEEYERREGLFRIVRL